MHVCVPEAQLRASYKPEGIYTYQANHKCPCYLCNICLWQAVTAQARLLWFTNASTLTGKHLLGLIVGCNKQQLLLQYFYSKEYLL